MEVVDKNTNSTIEVYGTRDNVINGVTYIQFLVYLEDTNKWVWVDAEDYHPIIPEGTK